MQPYELPFTVAYCAVIVFLVQHHKAVASGILPLVQSQSQEQTVTHTSVPFNLEQTPSP